MAAHRTALVIPAQGIDTSASNPASQLQLNILMAVAEFEREIIRERVNSGLRAARARGARLGRPGTLDKHLPRVRELLASGVNVSSVARELGLAYSSAHRIVSMVRREEANEPSNLAACRFERTKYAQSSRCDVLKGLISISRS